MIRFSCPHCTKKLKAPEGSAGRMITCPKCGQSLVVPAPVRSPGPIFPESAAISPTPLPPVGAVTAESSPGKIPVSCPGCDRTLQVLPDQLSLKLQCSHCNAVFVLTEPRPQPVRGRELVPDPLDFEAQAKAQEGSLAGIQTTALGDRTESSYERRPKMPTSGLVIASSAIGMYGFLIAGIGLFMALGEMAENRRGAAQRSGNRALEMATGMVSQDEDTRVGPTPGFYILAGGLCLGAALSPIGLILAVCAFMQRGRSHGPSFFGIALNGVSLLIFLSIYFLGSPTRRSSPTNSPTFENVGNKIGAAGS